MNNDAKNKIKQICKTKELNGKKLTKSELESLIKLLGKSIYLYDENTLESFKKRNKQNIKNKRNQLKRINHLERKYY